MRTPAIVLVAVTLATVGCATQKQWTATGGSKADGIVKLSFEYGGFERPVISVQDGVPQATARCQSWGYTGAEPFGGATRQCTATNQYGCIAYFVTAEYQCTGGR
jgi:hypothetical protein